MQYPHSVQFIFGLCRKKLKRDNRLDGRKYYSLPLGIKVMQQYVMRSIIIHA